MKSVRAAFLAGKIMPPPDFKYSNAEEEEAIKMILSTLTPEKYQALLELESSANQYYSAISAEGLIKAANFSKFAGMAWYNVVNSLPESRSKNILLSAKVIRFLGLAAGDLNHLIRTNSNAIDIATCENFLEIQVYVCALCIATGKYSLFEASNRLTNTVNKAMLAKFGAKATATSFGKAFNLAFMRDLPIEVQEYFYNAALVHIKDVFYFSANPPEELNKYYRANVYSRLEDAVVSENKEEEVKIRAEIDKMFARDQELQGNSHAVSYAGKEHSTKPHPTLRRRRPNI